MMRANLLPRPKETLTVFGVSADLEYVRLAGIGLTIVGLVVALTFGIERLRYARVEHIANAAVATFAAGEGERAVAQRLAFDLARLQAVRRRTKIWHTSGNVVAREVARIGNAIPATVYLDALGADRTAFSLHGGASSLDGIAETVRSVGAAFPGRRAALVDVTDRQTGTLDFTASLTAQAGDPSSESAPQRHRAPTGIAP